MKILFEQSGEAGIRECKIIADGEDEEKHLLEVREKIVELLGSAAVAGMTVEVLNGLADQDEPVEAPDLFATGGC